MAENRLPERETSVEDIRTALIEMIGFETPTARITVNLMCDLWSKWLEYRDNEATQKFYLGLSCLKEFKAFWMRIDPETKKTRRNDPLSKNLKIHAAKQLDDQDDLQQFLPMKQA